MDIPKTCGEAVDFLKKYYGVEEIKPISELSGIHRGTLDTWNIRRDSKLNAKGRDHFRRILSAPSVPADQQLAQIAKTQAAQAQPTADPGVMARLDQIEAMLRQVLTLRATDPTRLDKMIEKSSTLTSGDREMLHQVVEGLVSQREATQEALKEVLHRLEPRRGSHATERPRKRA